MRIVVNGRFSGRKTGVGRVIENLLINLQHLDQENEYFIYVNKEFVDFINISNDKFHLISNGVPAANSVLNHLWTQTGFLYSILKHRADLVVLPQINLFIVKLAPTILFQHDLIEYQLSSQKWYKQLFRKAAFPVAFKLSDRIVCVSENTRRDIRELFQVSEHKLATVLNGVDTGTFEKKEARQARDVISAKFGINDNNLILHTGTLTHPQKNLIRLVEAYKMLVDKGAPHKLVLVGGRGKDADLIFKRIEELHLTGNVITPGYVPDEDLPYFYSAATVFCFPSLYEGFGLPVLEAMACGCPVVASNSSSLPEVAGNAALLVDPYSAHDIARALHDLISNEQFRDDCIRKGFQQARQFSWDRSGRKLLAAMQEVAGRRATRQS